MENINITIISTSCGLLCILFPRCIFFLIHIFHNIPHLISKKIKQPKIHHQHSCTICLLCLSRFLLYTFFDNKPLTIRIFEFLFHIFMSKDIKYTHFLLDSIFCSCFFFFCWMYVFWFVWIIPHINEEHSQELQNTNKCKHLHIPSVFISEKNKFRSKKQQHQQTKTKEKKFRNKW